jgi:integrase
MRPGANAFEISEIQEERNASRQLKGIQNGTINRELAILQAMFRLGARSTMANGQPMVERLPAFPSKLREGKPRRGFLKDEQFAVLAANAKTPWLRAFIECDYKFGFRKSELLGLRKHQVDLIDGPYSRTLSRAASLLLLRHPGASVAPTFSPSVRTNPGRDLRDFRDGRI